MALHHRRQAAFILLTRIKIVLRLQGLIARQPILFTDFQCLLQTIGLIVGSAYRPHLTGLDQVVERRQGFRQRRVPVVVMRLIKVDIIGLQTPQ
ncbi:hypothetical protein D3C72_1378610 [compost metagenome]